MIAEEDIKVGAVVRLETKDGWSVSDGVSGKEYTITSRVFESGYFHGDIVEINAVLCNPKDFTLVPQENSIARPILAERKVGKVRMELVDDGFANALFEIAKVMSWASLNKGYKDGDWKSLPDMEKAFKGAASRHRTKHDIQRISDTAPLSCVDEESGLLHKAHEAFNVLAQLEMILTGRIK